MSRRITQAEAREIALRVAADAENRRRKIDMSETPEGWESWEAWQRSEQYAMLLRNLRAAIGSLPSLPITLAIEDLASCAFRAGLEARES